MRGAFTTEFIGNFILVFTVFGVIHRKAAAVEQNPFLGLRGSGLAWTPAGPAPRAARRHL